MEFPDTPINHRRTPREDGVRLELGAGMPTSIEDKLQESPPKSCNGKPSAPTPRESPHATRASGAWQQIREMLWPVPPHFKGQALLEELLEELETQQVGSLERTSPRA